MTGTRQVGKTTVLQYLAKRENIGRNYVTFDDPDTRKMAKEDPQLFFQIYKLPLIIDEVQYVPEIFS
ncbi:MAG: AAA family ATPase [Streptococcaceae bacterium]|nr:AAA family ATPase [Streptococcaceae bacterium]